jgi:hypothetical protein
VPSINLASGGDANFGSDTSIAGDGGGKPCKTNALVPTEPSELGVDDASHFEGDNYVAGDVLGISPLSYAGYGGGKVRLRQMR